MAVDKTIVNLIWKRKIGERGREIGENHRENGGSLGKIGESRWENGGGHRENGGNGFYFGERRRENGGSGREIGEHDPRIGGDASAMGKIARKKGTGLKAVPRPAKISGEPRIHVRGEFILNAHAISLLHFVAQAD
jgi:hypothetical protein